MSHPAPVTPAIRPAPSLPASKALALIGGALIAHQVTRTPESRARLLALGELAATFGLLSDADKVLILHTVNAPTARRRAAKGVRRG